MKKQIFNPIFPSWEYIPDGEPHVFGDRVYLYGSHDRFNGDDYCQNNYVCWSAPVDDLTDWFFHGEIFDISSDPFNENGQFCGYAPDCCQGPDGRFYLYYALNNHRALSVAVCDTPGGEYTFLGHVKAPDGHVLGTRDGDAYVFDPAVLVDDDNRVHLYMGFSPTKYMEELAALLKNFDTCGAHHFELCDDMLTAKSSPTLVVPGWTIAKGTSFDGCAFFEAPSIRKFFGKYYFIYSSEHFQELCYAIGDSPCGPFEYRGRLVSNGDIGIKGRTEPFNHVGNNHGSLCHIGEEFYIFYHRHTNNTPYSRQACAERIYCSDEGVFLQSEMTSCGLNNGPLVASGEYSAAIVCNISVDMADPPYLTQNGEDREDCPDQYLKGMRDGAVAGLKYFDFKGGEKISIRAVGTCEAVIEVSRSVGSKPDIIINLSQTDGDIREFSGLGEMAEGVSPLYFTYKGSGSCDFISFKIN